MLSFRQLTPKDYDPILRWRAAEKAFDSLADSFTYLWANTPELVPKELWAIDREGQLVASAGYLIPENTADLAIIGLIVAPNQRRQGIGERIFNGLLAKLETKGVQRLLLHVYAQQTAGLRFVAQRGFTEIGSSLNYQLNVAASQLELRDKVEAMVAARGLRIAPLNHFPRQGLAERLLPIWNLTRPDEPHYWPFVPLTNGRFEREILEAEGLALDHSLAMLTADQVIIALNLNTLDPDNRLMTVYTAVDPHFRGQKLATLLKKKLLTHAQTHNIAFLAAENHIDNKAMNHINRQLGYRYLSELLVYEKKLGSASAAST